MQEKRAERIHQLDETLSLINAVTSNAREKRRETKIDMIDKLDKYYLIEYSKTIEEIENEEVRLNIIYGLKGASSDGMGAKTTEVHDSISLKVEKIMDIKDKIEKLKSKEKVMGARVEKALDKLPPQEKQIIRLRYIDRQPWPVIIHALFHKCKDYEEHYDKYRSNIYKMHRRALKNIQKADEQWAAVVCQERNGDYRDMSS